MLTYLSPKFLASMCHKLRGEGKVIGLITGCFDIIHLGQIDLFRFAKEYVDVLLIGLEHDESIRISKRHKPGQRPVFDINKRNQVIREFRSVDYTFHVDTVYDFNSANAHSVFESVVARARPQVLISAPWADDYWQKRVETARKFGIKYLPYKKRYPSSSSTIIKQLEEET